MTSRSCERVGYRYRPSHPWTSEPTRWGPRNGPISEVVRPCDGKEAEPVLVSSANAEFTHSRLAEVTTF